MPYLKWRHWLLIAVFLASVSVTAGAYGANTNPVALVQSMIGIGNPAENRSTPPGPTGIAPNLTDNPSTATTPTPNSDLETEPPPKPSEASPPPPAPSTTPQPATPAGPTPKSVYELAAQDDGALIFLKNDAVAAATTHMIEGLPVSWTRKIVYSDKVYGPKKSQFVGFARYKTAIQRQLDVGNMVQVTISCNKRKWTTESFTAFVSQILEQFNQVLANQPIKRYSICNEPNLDDWLLPMPGLSVPDTYCELYKAGYAKIKEMYGDSSQVLIGELSSSDRTIEPLVFMNQLLRPDGKCAQLVADGFAYHPYGKITPPTPPTPNAPPAPGSLPVINAFLDQVASSGALRTPQGNRLDIYLTEYGWQSQDRGSRKAVPNRAALMQQDLHSTCYEIPHIAQFLIYQWIQSQPLEYWPGLWDTSIGGLIPQPNGTFIPQPDHTYAAIKQWAAQNPRCIKQ